MKTELSPQQEIILGLAALGLTSAEIGARMFITEDTVKSHLKRIYAKLGVNSRVKAIAVHMRTVDNHNARIVPPLERGCDAAGCPVRHANFPSCIWRPPICHRRRVVPSTTTA